MERMMDWIREKPEVFGRFSFIVLLTSAGALIGMEQVEAQCKPECHFTLPISINVSKGIFVVSGVGCFTSGLAASIKEPKR